MKIKFPYPEFPGLNIPDNNFAGIYGPQEMKNLPEDLEVISRGMNNPIGTPPLQDMVKPTDKVLIITDDNTRTTPLHLIVPVLVDKLLAAGVVRENIKVLIALGTHRPMTEQEIADKFGDIHKEISIVNHNWRDLDNLADAGSTSRGTPIVVNKEIIEADFVIGIGHIVPHRVAGFSGGSKIIQPGVCGGETTGKTHWLSAGYRGDEILGLEDNPVRQELNEAAQKVGLDVIINVVQDANKKVVELVMGDPVKAFHHGCETAREVYGVNIPARADIVIVDSYPADIEMWQAAKGVYTAGLAVKDGGTVILVTPCPEGVARQHPQITEFGYQSYQDVLDLVEKGNLSDLTVAAHIVHVGEVIADRAGGILVSSGIDRETAEKLNFTYAESPQRALEMALQKHGENASVIVLQHGGELLPVLS